MRHLKANMARILMSMPRTGDLTLTAAVTNLPPLTVLGYLNDLYWIGMVCKRNRKRALQRTVKDLWRLSAEGQRVMDVFRAVF